MVRTLTSKQFSNQLESWQKHDVEKYTQFKEKAIKQGIKFTKQGVPYKNTPQSKINDFLKENKSYKSWSKYNEQRNKRYKEKYGEDWKEVKKFEEDTSFLFDVYAPSDAFVIQQELQKMSQEERNKEIEKIKNGTTTRFADYKGKNNGTFTNPFQ